jgi:hypothetical protein
MQRAWQGLRGVSFFSAVGYDSTKLLNMIEDPEL